MGLKHSDLFRQVADLAELAHEKLRVATSIIEGVDPTNISELPLLVEIRQREAQIVNDLNNLRYYDLVRESMAVIEDLYVEVATEGETLVEGKRYLVHDGITVVYLPFTNELGKLLAITPMEGSLQASTIRIEGEGIDVEVGGTDFVGCHFIHDGENWIYCPSSFTEEVVTTTGRNSAGSYRISPHKTEQMIEVRDGETAPWPCVWPENHNIVSSMVSRQPRNTANSSGFTIYPEKYKVYLPDISGTDVLETGTVVDFAISSSDAGNRYNHYDGDALLVIGTDTIHNVQGSSGPTPMTTYGLNLFKVLGNGTAEPLITELGFSIDAPVASVSMAANRLFALESGINPDTRVKENNTALRMYIYRNIEDGIELSDKSLIATLTIYAHKLDSIELNDVEFGAIVAVTSNPAHYERNTGPNTRCQIFKVLDGSNTATEVVSLTNPENYNYTSVRMIEFGGFIYTLFSTLEGRNVKYAIYDIANATHLEDGVLTIPGPALGIDDIELAVFDGGVIATFMAASLGGPPVFTRLDFNEDGTILSNTPISISNASELSLTTDTVRYFFHGEHNYAILSEREKGVAISRFAGTGNSLSVLVGEEVYYPYCSESEFFLAGNTPLIFHNYSKLSTLANTPDTRDGRSDISFFEDKIGKLDALVVGIKETDSLV